MADSNRIRGNEEGPFRSQRPKEEEKVDPDKFKKVMKVDESDETQKRHKRQLKKEEEEGEDEKPVSDKTPPPPNTSFSEFMEDKEDVDSLFDKQAPGVRKQAASESPPKAPPPGMISTEHVDAEEEPPMPPPSMGEPPPIEAPKGQPTMPGDEFPNFEETFQKPPGEKEEPQPAPHEAKEPKKKDADASLLASQPKKDALKKKKPEETLKAEIEKVPAKKVASKEIKGDTKKEGVPLEEPPTLPSQKRAIPVATFERLTPTQIKDKKLSKKGEATPLVEGAAIPSFSETEMDMMGDEKKDQEDDFPFIDTSEQTANFPVSDQPLPEVQPPAEPSAVSQLSPQAHELFSQMAGTIMVQDHSGVVTTTVTIHMPNTVFDGSQIILDRYSTAPNSYNLQLVGNSQAVKAFSANLSSLNTAFTQGQYPFEVNILKPALPSKKPLIKRKGSSGGKGGKKK